MQCYLLPLPVQARHGNSCLMSHFSFLISCVKSSVKSAHRRLLLDEPTAAHRLRAEIAHMHTHMDRTLRCARCTASLACASDMFVSAKCCEWFPTNCLM